jgi:hypothetical protein
MKRCASCSRSLPLQAFRVEKAGRDGRRASCRECESAIRAARQQDRQDGGAEVIPILPTDAVPESVDDLLTEQLVRIRAAFMDPRTNSRELAGLSRRAEEIMRKIGDKPAVGGVLIDDVPFDASAY